MKKVLFLPGAGGSAAFWHPVGTELGIERTAIFFSWPGLGAEPPDDHVRGIDDLVAMVIAELDQPCDLVAQSLGGLVAIKAALAVPDKVRRLVLTVTSGGVPVADLGGSNWRADYQRAYPDAASWIMDVQEDLSCDIGRIAAPTLLLWGDADPISPPAVGERLSSLLPNAKFHIVHGGDHDLAQLHAPEVARLIADHLELP